MAPSQTGMDYYRVLEVDETADTSTITKSYKRLALLHHPDRNRGDDTTGAFQLGLFMHFTYTPWPPKLSEAYEILKDDEKRRIYDLARRPVNSISKAHSKPAGQTQGSASFAANPKQEDISQEISEILAILKVKEERAAKWLDTKKVYDGAISNLERAVHQLRSAIEGLEAIDKAEDAEEFKARAWKAWLLFPVYQQPTQTEEEKESKARERLQRLHNRAFKEADLKNKEADLKKYQDVFRSKTEEFDLANKRDDVNKTAAEARIRVKRQRVQQEREKWEAAERARVWQEKVEKEREETEARAKATNEWWKRQKKAAAEERKRQQEKERREAEEREIYWKEKVEKWKREAEEAEEAEKVAEKRRKRQEKERKRKEKEAEVQAWRDSEATMIAKQRRKAREWKEQEEQTRQEQDFVRAWLLSGKRLDGVDYGSPF